MYLTKRQKEILEFLTRYMSRHGYAPTFDEIASNFGFSSKGTVYKHIKTLEGKGVIQHAWNRTRAIEIKTEESAIQTLPILGLVSAGNPIEAIETTEELEVPTTFLGAGRHYVLNVIGDSMVDEQIRDGDYVIVQERISAENGETVVALIDGSETIIKKFFQKNGLIELRPANERLKSLEIEPERVKLQGIVVGVLRRY